MIFQSTYFNKNILIRLINSWKLPLVFLFAFSILIVSSFNNPYPIAIGNSRRKKSIIELIIDSITGLQYYGLTQFIFSIVIFMIIGLVIFGYLYTEHKKMKMIVGLEFDLQKDQLIIFTKDLLNRKMKTNLKLSTVKLKENISKDRFGTREFNCLCFISKNFLMGRIYIDHFTWNNNHEIDLIKSYF
jgi:hypothetical protein